jgi:hypothetical protein
MRLSYVVQVLALGAFLAPSAVAIAQSNRTAAEETFHKRYFVSYQTATITDVPVARQSLSSSAEGTDGTGGAAFGAGVSFVGGGRWLFQLAYDRAAAKFSTWLDADRTIAFHSVDMTVGYSLSSSGPVAVVPFFTFAPGWYRQSSWNDPRDFDIHDTQHKSSYEGLQGYDYTIALAIGAKIGVLKRFALTAEMRKYNEDQGGGACGATPNCIDLTDRPPAEKYATRTSVGLQFYFGRMGKY